LIKYNENYVYLSSLSLPNELSDITSMDEDSVAVASLSSDDIYLINIKTMTLTKTIKVNFDGFEDLYTSGYKIHFPQNSVCFQK
jgi:hypothetical protein